MRCNKYHGVASAYMEAFKKRQENTLTPPWRSLTRLNLMLHLKRLPATDRHFLAAELLRHGMTYKDISSLLRYV